MENKTNLPIYNSITNPANTNSLSPKLLLTLTLLLFLGIIGFAIFLLNQKVVNKETQVQPHKAQIPNTIPTTFPKVEQLSLSLDEQIAQEIATASAQLLFSFQQNDAASIKSLKKQLLTANNLSLVVLGAALDFIPLEKIKITYGSLEDEYELETYGIELTDKQHKQLTNLITKQPVNVDLNKVGKELEAYLSSDSQSWLYFGDILVQNHEYFMKDGYVCHIRSAWCRAHPEGGLDEYLERECKSYSLDTESGWFSSYDSCCRPYKTDRWYDFACAYAQKPYENNAIINRRWTYQVLSEVGINCETECLEPRRDIVYIQLPKFARRIEHQDDNPKELIQLTVSQLTNDMRNLRRAFHNSGGWITTFTDPDIEGRSVCKYEWCKNRPTLLKTLIAKNEKFRCTQSLEVWLSKDDKVVKQERKVSCSYRDGANLDLD